ncbi:T cell activation RhoGTPase activating protein b isoform X1 [Oryzias melastigma]|uniref:T cell activation RhoGTPase activating protein b n=3 Tax=Oryzias melastigma TaxID=30732 RepID=A0A3B3E1D5_ORYME|nr:T cell activation RhoGTPase activating protein b isoform X1 [Oryzias melastigma]
MDPLDYETAAMRRGSYDDAASLRPHFRHLAQRRRSAPSLVLGKALGMPWSPIREEVSVEQSPFVLGLTSENGELLLDECVQVSQGHKTRERHLFLFRDVIVFAKLKSMATYRLKHRVNLEDVWLYGFEDELEDEEDATIAEFDLRLTIVLAWELSFCLVCFCSPEVKGHWCDTLRRNILNARVRAGFASSPPDVLMKVLSGSIATKTLTGGGMEQMIDLPIEGDAKNFVLSKQLNNQDERSTQLIETKWNLVRNKMKLRKGSSNKACRAESGTKGLLFGQQLGKICPNDYSLPKPIMDLLVQLRKKGPSTEGVFRKPCNNKNMKDIREQLNCRAEVDLEDLPVVLIVGLLKSFLKELPGSLLRSDLYSKWMTALNNEDAQQRTQEITKVVDELPAANKLLLQYLICVLHHILESADINKMDAHNLAVCIGPTLLQLDDTPLDGQREKMQKVTELTQFLIENCEILGENIPSLLDTDEDSLSSLHHDSAYDSTDPDGDGEAGEKRSSTNTERGSSSSCSSLSPSMTTSSWQSDVTLNTKTTINRRCSEPIIFLSAELASLCGHARSHDDCSMERSTFDEQPLKKQISDDSFLLKRNGASSALSFPKLSSSTTVDLMPYMGKDCSCSSLESTASNQSEGSVFASSPKGSPGYTRRTTDQPSDTTQEIPRPITDEKKRSQSMRVTSKVLMRTRSLGAFSRSSYKRDSQKENSFPCETLPEDSQSEADPSVEVLRRQRPQSAIEVFKHVDSKLPGQPPSYEQAMQNLGFPPQYGSMTVQDAKKLERRSRPSSVNYDFSTADHVYSQDCFAQTAQDCGVERRQAFRPRAMSESVSMGHHEVASRRCSHPVFEEFSYAKESYV